MTKRLRDNSHGGINIFFSGHETSRYVDYRGRECRDVVININFLTACNPEPPMVDG